jgi:hypothetical protein
MLQEQKKKKRDIPLRVNPYVLFHFRRAAFSSQLEAKVGSTLAKAAALRVDLNLDGTHAHPSYS